MPRDDARDATRWRAFLAVAQASVNEDYNLCLGIVSDEPEECRAWLTDEQIATLAGDVPGRSMSRAILTQFADYRIRKEAALRTADALEAAAFESFEDIEYRVVVLDKGAGVEKWAADQVIASDRGPQARAFCVRVVRDWIAEWRASGSPADEPLPYIERRHTTVERIDATEFAADLLSALGEPQT